MEAKVLGTISPLSPLDLRAISPTLEAKVSGSDVPSATKVMAVTLLLRPIVQPTCSGVAALGIGTGCV